MEYIVPIALLSLSFGAPLVGAWLIRKASAQRREEREGLPDLDLEDPDGYEE